MFRFKFMTYPGHAVCLLVAISRKPVLRLTSREMVLRERFRSDAICDKDFPFFYQVVYNVFR